MCMFDGIYGPSGPFLEEFGCQSVKENGFPLYTQAVWPPAICKLYVVHGVLFTGSLFTAVAGHCTDGRLLLLYGTIPSSVYRSNHLSS